MTGYGRGVARRKVAGFLRRTTGIATITYDTGYVSTLKVPSPFYVTVTADTAFRRLTEHWREITDQPRRTLAAMVRYNQRSPSPIEDAMVVMSLRTFSVLMQCYYETHQAGSE